MTIFIDADFKCHLENDGAMREIETDFFIGKCRQYIEGFRYIPEGETWTDDDGRQYSGLLIVAHRDYSVLAELQSQYEEMLAEAGDMRSALDAIYGGDTDDGT